MPKNSIDIQIDMMSTICFNIIIRYGIYILILTRHLRLDSHIFYHNGNGFQLFNMHFIKVTS